MEYFCALPCLQIWKISCGAIYWQEMSRGPEDISDEGNDDAYSLQSMFRFYWEDMRARKLFRDEMRNLKLFLVAFFRFRRIFSDNNLPFHCHENVHAKSL